jgi:hypothetical protein
MANRLAAETSPYLLQHQDNPVDWYAWGEEAFARARAEDKPVLVSIGYSACHWCHVMEHESFESEAIAARMNDAFVCVKVDREERPDVDAIYMEAVQAMTGRGGWPLNAFLTPEGVPSGPEPTSRPSHARTCRAGPWSSTRSPTRGASSATDRARAAGSPRLRAPRTAGARAELDPRALDAGGRDLRVLRRRARRLGRGRSTRSVGDRVPAARGEPENGASHAARGWPPAACTTRSAAGFARYSVDAQWIGRALREDALRQRAARPAYLHAGR